MEWKKNDGVVEIVQGDKKYMLRKYIFIRPEVFHFKKPQRTPGSGRIHRSSFGDARSTAEDR